MTSHLKPNKGKVMLPVSGLKNQKCPLILSELDKVDCKYLLKKF